MWPYLQSQTGLQAGLCERSIAILEDSALRGWTWLLLTDKSGGGITTVGHDKKEFDSRSKWQLLISFALI